MEYYKVDPAKPDVKSIQAAVEVLKNNGIIVYPTDTLYGLGVDILREKALNKLFLLKKRNKHAPVSFIIDSIKSIDTLIGPIDPQIKKILKVLLPGKYTVLLENKNSKTPINLSVLNGHNKARNRVGVRIPDNPVCLELSRQMKGPIASTSANISGEQNTLSITEVVAQFGNRLDLILDAGKIRTSLGSTVIDFTKTPFLVVREGDVSFKELKVKLPGILLKKRKTKFIINFICSGNICRSPLAEGIMKKMIEKTRFKEVVDVKSAGTLDLASVPAHDFSIKIADDEGLDISSHRSRRINEKIVVESDLIFCLALNHLNFLRDNFPEHKEKIFLIREWKREQRLSNPSIADPIGHDLKFFKTTYDEIFSELKRVFPEIMTVLKNFISYNEIDL